MATVKSRIQRGLERIRSGGHGAFDLVVQGLPVVAVAQVDVIVFELVAIALGQTPVRGLEPREEGTGLFSESQLRRIWDHLENATPRPSSAPPRN